VDNGARRGAVRSGEVNTPSGHLFPTGAVNDHNVPAGRFQTDGRPTGTARGNGRPLGGRAEGPVAVLAEAGTETDEARPDSVDTDLPSLVDTRPPDLDDAGLAGLVDTGPLDVAERRRSRRRRWLTILSVVLALGVLVAMTLRGRFPSIPEIMSTAVRAQPGWVLLAAALQLLSIALFAIQQRSLLSGLHVRVRFGRTMAITFARSAISISLPAGAAVSAGYALREYRRAGASYDVAAATMVVSGLVSIGGLAMVYVGGAVSVLVQHPGSSLNSPVPLAVLAAFAVILVASGVRRLRRRRTPEASTPKPRSEPRRAWSRYVYRLLVTARDAWRAGASLGPLHWSAALVYAAGNWLTDLLCLAACTHALGLPIDVTTLAGIYLGVQIVRQIPITPGGVGLIETAFIAGLTAAGATAASATAAVLIYRVLSCWLLLPVGGIAAVLIRRSGDAIPAANSA